jgi:hypothetical protein
MSRPTVPAKQYWKCFVFAWALPPLLLLGLGASIYLHLPDRTIPPVLVLIVIGCYIIASKPIWDGRVTLGECFWWIGIVPVFVWFVLGGCLLILDSVLR